MYIGWKMSQIDSFNAIEKKNVTLKINFEDFLRTVTERVCLVIGIDMHLLGGGEILHGCWTNLNTSVIYLSTTVNEGAH